MHQYMYPPAGVIPVYYYMIPAPTLNAPMFGREQEFRIGNEDNGNQQLMRNARQKISNMGNMPQMSNKNINQQIPNKNVPNMSKMNIKKMKSDVQEIVNMFEQHHPDIIRTLTNCKMSASEAKQYLSRIVEMSLMHHMMHQM